MCDIQSAVFVSVVQNKDGPGVLALKNKKKVVRKLQPLDVRRPQLQLKRPFAMTTTALPRIGNIIGT